MFNHNASSVFYLVMPKCDSPCCFLFGYAKIHRQSHIPLGDLQARLQGASLDFFANELMLMHHELASP